MQPPDPTAPRPRTSHALLGRLQPLVLLAICIGVASLALPRLRNVAGFFRFFGRPPASSPVSAWLAATETPPNAHIISGPQSWIPPQYEHVVDGIWHPRAIESIYQARKLPFVYIEDKSSYELNFSPAVHARGFNTSGQQAMHARGAALYAALQHNAMQPFVLAHAGEEVIGTNTLHPFSAEFRLYANPLAYSPNLALQAVMSVLGAGGGKNVLALPPKQPGALSLQWESPVTASTIHVVTRGNCRDVSATIETADGGHESYVIPRLGAEDAEADATHHLIRLAPAKDIVGMKLVTSSTADAPCLISDVNVHPLVPVGLNATRQYFEMISAGGAAPDLSSLFAWRPMTHPGVRIPAGETISFELKRRMECDISDAVFVLDSVPAGSCSARCVFRFADGSKVELEGTERRSLAPAHVYFLFECPGGNEPVRIEGHVSSQVGAILRQVHVNARPALEAAAR